MLSRSKQKTMLQGVYPGLQDLHADSFYMVVVGFLCGMGT